jgi:F0F1-type ATP synthase assembly protein I
MLGFIAGVRTMLRSAKEIQEKQMADLAKDEEED